MPIQSYHRVASTQMNVLQKYGYYSPMGILIEIQVQQSKAPRQLKVVADTFEHHF
jgi:hypothetical protein